MKPAIERFLVMLAKELSAHAIPMSKSTKRRFDRFAHMFDVDLDKPIGAQRKTTTRRKTARYSRA